MKKATREWVRKAEKDFRGALRLASANEPFHDLVAFHCQQSAEKYLKALLEELGQHIPQTHALGDLLNRLLPARPTLASLRRGLLYLTDFALDPPSPSTGTSKREAAAALRWASKVRDACRSILGLRPLPRRRNGP
jgi:HEPN domain-containing protein